MGTRVAVFIDYQNVYMSAREAFGWADYPGEHGHVSPWRLGVALCDKGREKDPEREVTHIRVYKGEPSSKHNRVGHGASQRQVAAWNQESKVCAETRPLAYHDGVPREKGIDVLLALAIAGGARDKLYDVAVICSRDTDLVPAAQEAIRFGRRVEVMAWKGSASRLNVPDTNVWCHWLDRHDYNNVKDLTDYRPRRR